VLRAKASAVGLALHEVSDVDLAAAAIAADAWMLVTHATSLERPAAQGAAAVRALTAVLSRAAGDAFDEPDETVEASLDPALVSAADGYALWASSQLGEDGPEALRRAASDLAHAGPTGPLAAFSELLAISADHAGLS
jgi:hypothetical protein